MTKSVSSTRRTRAPLRAHRVHLFLDFRQRQRREFRGRQLVGSLQKLLRRPPTKRIPNHGPRLPPKPVAPLSLASLASASGNSMVSVVTMISTGGAPPPITATPRQPNLQSANPVACCNAGPRRPPAGRSASMRAPKRKLPKIRLQGVQKTGWVLEIPIPRSFRESPECPIRQVRPMVRRERRNPAPTPPYRMLRYTGDSARLPPTVHVPGRIGPRSPRIERPVSITVVAAGLRQPSADPLGDRYGHRVAEQPPPVPTGPAAEHRCPSFRKTLEPLHGLDRRRHDPSRRQQHRWRRRNRQCRPRLQRRTRVPRQAVAGPTLRPVESHGTGRIDSGPIRVAGVIGEQYVAGIPRWTGHDEHATPTLRKAETPGCSQPDTPTGSQAFRAVPGWCRSPFRASDAA